MAILIDTSILGRLADSRDSSHRIAQDAVDKLHSSGAQLSITAQNLVEFRNFATRPFGPHGNGMGLSVTDASKLMIGFEAVFPMLPETPAIYPAWRALVDGLVVIGKTVHDACLVAVCHVHGVSQLLTFNVSQFTTLAKFGPGLVVLDPRAVRFTS